MSKSYLTVTDQFCGAALRLKTCVRCANTKPITSFYRRPDSPDGYRNDCKECTKERANTSAQRNIAFRRAYMKKYGEQNREHLNAEARRRAKENGRKYYFRRYRSDNRESVLENERRYRAKNRHKQAARLAARRAMPLDGVARKYMAILLGDRCSYCGAPASSIDHIVPVSSGGTNAWDNLTAACKSCNSKKHDRSLMTFVLELHA